MNEKRFSAESNLIHRNESNRPVKGVHTGGRAGGAARREVTVKTHGMGTYKPTIGEVILSDGMNLNQELVKQGWCWWYRKYAPGVTVQEHLEREAGTARIGLWADPQPVPPWEWRKRTR